MNGEYSCILPTTYVLVLPIRVRILGLGALSLSSLAHVDAERQALLDPPTTSLATCATLEF